MFNLLSNIYTFLYHFKKFDFEIYIQSVVILFYLWKSGSVSSINDVQTSNMSIISLFCGTIFKGREENKNKYFESQLFLFSDFPFWRVGSVCKTENIKTSALRKIFSSNVDRFTQIKRWTVMKFIGLMLINYVVTNFHNCCKWYSER